jgi:hypothetical protein
MTPQWSALSFTISLPTLLAHYSFFLYSGETHWCLHPSGVQRMYRLAVQCFHMNQLVVDSQPRYGKAIVWMFFFSFCTMYVFNTDFFLMPGAVSLFTTDSMKLPPLDFTFGIPRLIPLLISLSRYLCFINFLPPRLATNESLVFSII